MAGEHGPGGTAEGSGGDVVTAEATALARTVNCPHCWAPPRVPVAACPGDRGGISGPGGALGGTGPGTRGAVSSGVPVSAGCRASGPARPPDSGTGGG